MLLVIAGDGDIPAEEADAILTDQAEALAAEGDEIGGLVFCATAETPSDGINAIYLWATENGVAFDAIGPYASLFEGADYTDDDADAYGALYTYLQGLESDDWTFKILSLFSDTKGRADEDADVEAFCAQTLEAGWPTFMMNGQMYQFGEAATEAPAKPAKKAAVAAPPVEEDEEEEIPGDPDIPEDVEGDDDEAGWSETNLRPLTMPVLKQLAEENGVKLLNARSKDATIKDLLDWQTAQAGGAPAEVEEGDDEVEPTPTRTGPRPVDETDEREALKAVMKEALAELLAEMAGAVLAR